MPEDREKSVICEVCKQPKTGDEVFPLAIVHEPIFRMIQRDHPEVSKDGWICSSDLNLYRMEFVKLALEEEKGELTALEEEVVRSIQEQETVSKNINTEYEGRITLGGRMSDRLAAYGGSFHRRPLSLDRPQCRSSDAQAVRSLPLHPPQPNPLLSGGHPGAHHLDEPEPSGCQGPASFGI
jgi:hypothetical protein